MRIDQHYREGRVRCQHWGGSLSDYTAALPPATVFGGRLAALLSRKERRKYQSIEYKNQHYHWYIQAVIKKPLLKIESDIETTKKPTSNCKNSNVM